MNTVVTSTRNPEETRLHEHPPQHNLTVYAHELRRVGLLDRAALRVGVALITWGRRSALVESHAPRTQRVGLHEALRERELAAERMRHLGTPRS